MKHLTEKEQVKIEGETPLARFERLSAINNERAAVKYKKTSEKKYEKKIAFENIKSNIYEGMDISEINSFNARRNLPSSLR